MSSVRFLIVRCADSHYVDTIFSPVAASGVMYTFSEQGIAWTSDFSTFKKSSYSPDSVSPPPDWTSYANYTADNFPDLSTDEHLMVWIRSAALPGFRKLWSHRSQGLPLGAYTIDIRSSQCISSIST